MTLTEIENLSFADLKAKRDELLASLKDADRAELTARYLQARTDAKQRDEKLAEQGQTITALQAGTAALTQQVESLTLRANAADEQVAKLEQMNRSIEERLTKALETCKSEAAAAIQNLTADLAQETARANAGEALAKARRGGLAEVIKVVSPLLAAE